MGYDYILSVSKALHLSQSFSSDVMSVKDRLLVGIPGSSKLSKKVIPAEEQAVMRYKNKFRNPNSTEWRKSFKSQGKLTSTSTTVKVAANKKVRASNKPSVKTFENYHLVKLILRLSIDLDIDPNVTTSLIDNHIQENIFKLICENRLIINRFFF